MKKRLLAICLTLCLCIGMLPSAAMAELEQTPMGGDEGESPSDLSEPTPAETVYVSAAGSDESGDGSEGNPYATLTTAVKEAKDQARIVVMSDLTMTESVRFWDKNLTITSGDGGPHTVTRGDFEQGSAHEPARLWYNPAMIEVGSAQDEGSGSLTITNIIFDDADQRKGNYFIQADSEGDGETHFGNEDIRHSDIVQDAIIATYHGNGKITLGDGAVLKNYGGMSAVRVSGGTLVMENGSKIIDDSISDRIKGTTIAGADKSLYGPAGAIWVQGGTVTVDAGAYIGGSTDKPMIGRGIYLDGGEVEMNGTIQYVKGDTDCWMGENGIGVHIRNSGTATIGGTVGDLTASSTTAGRGVYATAGTLILDETGVVKNCTMMNAVYVSGCRDGLSTVLRGTVSGNTLGGDNGYAVVIENSDATFASTSVIENNNSKIATVYAPAGAKIELYGKIRNNVGGQCGGIFLYGNYTAYRDITVAMYDGAEITGNKNTDFLRNRGGAICSGGSTHGPHSIFTMHGGLISGNTSSSGAVLVRKNGQAYMTGGTISDNSGYGVRVDGSDSGMTDPFFKMSGGQIINNGSSGISATATYGTVLDITEEAIVKDNNNANQISISGGDATDEKERAMIDAGVLSGERTVSAAGYNLRLEEEYADIGLGQANAAVKDAITSYLRAPEYDGWTVVGNALWLKPSENSVDFQLGRSSSIKKLGLFVAYIPLDEDGIPVSGANVVLTEVNNDDWIDISLKDLVPGTPYGLVLVHNKEYTLNPDAITIYTGGGQGDENYDNGFPVFTINNCIDTSFVKNPATGKYGYDLKRLVVDGKPYTATATESLLDQLIGLLDVTYTYEDGTTATNDFKAGVYTARLSWKDDITDTGVKVNENEVKLGEGGPLIVRYIEDIQNAQDGENTYELLESEPTNPVDHAEAIAKKGGYSGTTLPEFYTNDDEDRTVDAGGIQLLDDGLLLQGDDSRQELMEQKAEEKLGAPGEGRTYKYDFHYLDLVDAFNGNAWVSAEYGTTVYLPYPEEVTADTAEALGVKVLHYKDLHREYGISGQAEVEEAINACELEEITVEFDANGIKFDVPREGFSPFAIIWQTKVYTVTFSPGDHGTLTGETSCIVPDGSTMQASGKVVPTVDGAGNYEFTGWRDQDGNTYTSSQILSLTITGSMTFTAQYRYTGGTTTRYILHYDSNGGTKYDDERYARNTVVDLDKIPTREGYTFTGWYADKGLSERITEIKMTANKTVYAGWEATGVPSWLNGKDHFAYVIGYSDGTVRPLDHISRAEVGTIVFRLLDPEIRNENLTTANTFEDVDEGMWCNTAISTLARLGIVNGRSAQVFDPDASITRAEFAAICARFDGSGVKSDSSFTDISGHWAEDEIERAAALGWICGYTDGTFRPNNRITRAEVMTMINRMLQRLPEEENDLLPDMNIWPDNQPDDWYYLAVQEATNSHDFSRKSDRIHEHWNNMTADPDWKQYE